MVPILTLLAYLSDAGNWWAGFCNFVLSHFFKTQLIPRTFAPFPCKWIKLFVSLSIIWKHFDCFILPSVGFKAPRVALNFSGTRLQFQWHLRIAEVVVHFIFSLTSSPGFSQAVYCFGTWTLASTAFCFQRWPILWSEEDNDHSLSLHHFTFLLWASGMEMH